MKTDLKDFDYYQITYESIVTDFDMKLITRLYQPILGHTAISIYITLINEYKINSLVSDRLTHKRLLSIMQISMQDFIAGRMKLESFGLLKTYVKESNQEGVIEYRYFINSPKNPSDFYKDTLLSSLLFQALGEVEYQRTQYFYTSNESLDENFVNISATFEENYQKQSINKKDLSTSFIDKKESDLNSSYNINDFINSMSNYLIPKYVFSTKVKKEIIRLRALFSLDDNSLNQAFLNSIDVDENKQKSLNLVRFNKECEKFQEKNVTTDDFDDELYKFASSLDNTDSLQYYAALQNVKTLFKDDIQLLRRFQEMGIAQGVINSVLYYCVSKKKSTISFNSYIEKVMSSVVKSKCNNAYEALLFLKKNSYSKKKSSDIIEKKEEDLQDYVDAFKELSDE